MNVAYVGNFSRNSIGEPEIANSLEELGHKVFRIDEFKTTKSDIEKVIREQQCKLFLFAKLRVSGVSIEWLKSLPCKTCCWQFDLMYGIEE